jgi:hypothetical protein
VGEDLEEMKFNTAIASFMEFLILQKKEKKKFLKKQLKTF